MRITVSYFEGYPELEADLVKFSPRARAERLRLLAVMGLSVMQHGRFINMEILGTTVPALAQAFDDKPVVSSAEKEVSRNITNSFFNQVE